MIASIFIMKKKLFNLIEFHRGSIQKRFQGIGFNSSSIKHLHYFVIRHSNNTVLLLDIPVKTHSKLFKRQFSENPTAFKNFSGLLFNVFGGKNDIS